MSEIEKQIIEASKKVSSASTLKIKLDKLHLNKAKLIEVPGANKAVVMYVPCSELATFKQEPEIVAAFEKQLSGCQVHIVGDRKIEHRTPKAYRPYCKTSVAVHEALFEDLVYPAYISGKRITYANQDKTNKFYITKSR